MAFRPSLKKKRQLASVDVNITPVMNLIVVLIPLLLSTAKLVDLAMLEYQPPVIEETSDVVGGGEGIGGGGQQLLELRVNVAYNGLEVSVFNATSGEHYTSIPMQPDGTYDFAALREKLVEIKEKTVGPPLSRSEQLNPQTGLMEIAEVYKYSDADQIRISAEGDIPLQVIINVMDAAREYRTSRGVFHPLFPSPALGQFQ